MKTIVHVHPTERVLPVDFDPALGYDVFAAQLLSMLDCAPSAVLAVSPGGVLAVSSEADFQRSMSVATPAGTPAEFIVSIDPAVSTASRIDLESTCSRSMCGDGPVTQPRFKCVDRSTGRPPAASNEEAVCVACAQVCLQFATHSSGLAIALDGQGNVGKWTCGCQNCIIRQPVGSLPVGPAQASFQLLLPFVQMRLRMQNSSPVAAFERKIRTYVEQTREYESPVLQQKVRAALPKTIQSLSVASPVSFDLLVAVMDWFKTDFFSWVNAPPCDACAGTTSCVGMTAATVEERRWKAGHVELYTCMRSCTASAASPSGQITRFPRFNSAEKLLETRRGRCGEWAQAFTLICRSLGYDTRFVVDWTDHVWTEVFLPEQNKWIHCDCCENIRDGPMVYEGGWGKRLSYVVAVSPYEVRDVTRRYTRKMFDEHGPLTRRTEVPEPWLAEFCRTATAELAQHHPRGSQFVLHNQSLEDVEFDSLNVQELSAAPLTLKPEEQLPRISGASH